MEAQKLLDSYTCRLLRRGPGSGSCHIQAHTVPAGWHRGAGTADSVRAPDTADSDRHSLKAADTHPVLQPSHVESLCLQSCLRVHSCFLGAQL